MKTLLAFLLGAVLVGALDILERYLELEEDYEEATDVLAKIATKLPNVQ